MQIVSSGAEQWGTQKKAALRSVFFCSLSARSCLSRAHGIGKIEQGLLPMEERFFRSPSFESLKRPRLPRITRCPSGRPLESGPSRAEKGTTPSAGNAHPKAHRNPIESLFRWALRAHRFPSKSPSIPIGTTIGWAVGES